MDQLKNVLIKFKHLMGRKGWYYLFLVFPLFVVLLWEASFPKMSILIYLGIFDWGDKIIALLLLLTLSCAVLLVYRNIGTIKRNVFPFFCGINKRKTESLLVLIGLILFSGILYLFFYDREAIFKRYNRDTVIAISSILLTIMGIFISAKVLITVTRDKTITVLDWLSMNIDMIDEAENGDEIYLLAPTFCAGLTITDEGKNRLDILYDIIQKKTSQGVVFNFGFLCCSGQKIDPEGHKVNMNVNKNYLDEIFTSPHDQMYKIFLEKEYSKIDREEVPRKINFVVKNYNLIRDYRDRIVGINPKSLIWKDLSYIEIEEQRDPRDSLFGGFFATVNITKGRYYLGSFSNKGVTTTFEGTSFDNKHISTKMKGFIEELMKEGQMS